MIESNDISRKKRGEIDKTFKLSFSEFSGDFLIGLLDDKDPRTRTVSATLLGEKKYYEAIPSLCKSLIVEKALYSKIAISEGLGAMGVKALPELIRYIGKIGKNHHKELPSEIFKKWSYPLPRDIVIRTIVKMGKSALPNLSDALKIADAAMAAELIDAIGHISFYSQNTDAFEVLMDVHDKHKQNEVVIWKLLRALQSFNLPKGTKILEEYFIQSAVPQLRWEAARSLGQLNEEKILKKGLNDSNPLVKKMVELGLKHILDSKRKNLPIICL